jgi:L-alanine-DL-glutamate epimerase-like enolase superfamily enzyme
MSATLEIARITIPFRRAFRHAAAERSETESVWVEVRTRRGAVGHGEACPRRYVTGEDLASVRAFFRRHRASWCERIEDLSDLVAWTAAHRAEIDRHPAAWCAVELAWLDALARERGVSVEALLGLDEVRGPFRYSAVIGVEQDVAFRTMIDRYVAAGFVDFKIKLSGHLARDRARLRWFAQHSPKRSRLRLDANNLWACPAEAARYLERLGRTFFAVEEPLRPASRYRALAELAAALRVRVILDESCLRAEQLAALTPRANGPSGEGPAPWIVNVRVSKMGGLLRSLRAVEVARGHGLPVVVGAQVGETSLLTRAALTVASQARDILMAQEGAFGTLLLSADVCDEPLMFGPAGLLEWPTAPGPGFGLRIRRDAALFSPM